MFIWSIRTLMFAVVLASFTLIGTSHHARADTVTVTGGPAAGPPIITLVPNIPPVAGVERTTFTSYSGNGSYGYAILPFTVTQSGAYSASVTTTEVTNTAWFLTGSFSPSAPPTAPSTPLGDFFAAVFAGTTAPYTDSFTNLSLTAGTQYSLLIAFNTGGSPNIETYSVSMTGPGCTNIGSNVCVVTPVPTLSVSTMILYALAIATVGVLLLTFGHAALAKHR